jgi:hypothetical protein
MSKRGVFGEKSTPIFPAIDYSDMKEPKEVTVKAVDGGFIVRCSHEYHMRGKESVVKTIEEALEYVKDHLSKSMKDSKEEKE